MSIEKAKALAGALGKRDRHVPEGLPPDLGEDHGRDRSDLRRRPGLQADAGRQRVQPHLGLRHRRVQLPDNSTRTRFSFASASDLLGLYVQDLDEGKSQIAHGETVRETATMISFLAEAIGIRDDMYLGEGDRYQREVGKSLDEAVAAGVLPDRPTVVNLQSDIDHPTQSMADFLHLAEHFGGLDKLKGKKIAMTWAYSPSYGKPLSVPQGVIGLATRFGMDVTLAHPEGYDLIPDVVELSAKQAAASGGSFKKVYSMEEAFKDADIVYPKSWAPYDVMQKRVPLLHAGDTAGLKDLEKTCLANNAKFKAWECDEAKMKLTKGGKALYMHCLPADITESPAQPAKCRLSLRPLPGRHLPRGRLEALHHRRHDSPGQKERSAATLDALIKRNLPRQL
jgi:knotted carbamoyltransferase YgeW